MQNIFEESNAVLNGAFTANSEPVIELRHARFFDISFLYEGSEIEPDAPVSVELTYDRPDLDYDSFDIYSDVIHFADDMTVIME